MITFTGGSGRIGRMLKHLFPYAYFPTHAQYDILGGRTPALLPALVVHMAALVGEEKCSANCKLAQQVNVQGTANVMRLGVPVLYFSTSYVFSGVRGYYKTTDTPDATTIYGRTKADAEKIVLDNGGKVVRFALWHRPFPYPVACTDMYTSGRYADEVVPQLASAIKNFKNLKPITHIGSSRISLYTLACDSKPDVKPTTLAEMQRNLKVVFPRDTSFCNMETVQCD